MERLPILFLFTETVQGNGFQAYVTAQGRALLERSGEGEEGEVCLMGVQPGGIAESAAGEQQAYKKFNTLYSHVLKDMANETESYDVFELKVQRFFKEVCDPAQEEWWAAVRRVRKEHYREGSLASKPAGTPVGVTVERVEQLAVEHGATNKDYQQEPVLALAA